MSNITLLKKRNTFNFALLKRPMYRWWKWNLCSPQVRTTWEEIARSWSYSLVLFWYLFNFLSNLFRRYMLPVYNLPQKQIFLESTICNQLQTDSIDHKALKTKGNNIIFSLILDLHKLNYQDMYRDEGENRFYIVFLIF